MPYNRSLTRIEKRRAEIDSYLKRFKQYLLNQDLLEIEYKSDSVNLINDLYWRYADEIIRLKLDSKRIQHFKIIACTELVVLIISPIQHKEPNYEKLLNSRLALFISLEILVNWHQNDVDFKEYERVFNDDDIKQIVEEHMNWLYQTDPNFYNPIFANGQFWRLFYLLIKEKIKNLDSSKANPIDA